MYGVLDKKYPSPRRVLRKGSSDDGSDQASQGKAA